MMALGRTADHIMTVEIEANDQAQARENATGAGSANRVTFVLGDALDNGTLRSCAPFDSAFLDPDWAVTGPDPIHRFRPSNTGPPADQLLQEAPALTADVAIVLPPFIDVRELEGLRDHHRQRLYPDGKFALIRLYFRSLARIHRETKFVR
jgi:hypothetical protein